MFKFVAACSLKLVFEEKMITGGSLGTISDGKINDNHWTSQQFTIQHKSKCGNFRRANYKFGGAHAPCLHRLKS